MLGIRRLRQVRKNYICEVLKQWKARRFINELSRGNCHFTQFVAINSCAPLAIVSSGNFSPRLSYLPPAGFG